RKYEASRFPVRRQEGIHRALEVLVLENLRRQIEGIVVLGGVERLSHGCRVIAHVVHLTEDPRHGAVGRQHHRPEGLQNRDQRWELLIYLRQQHVRLVQFLYDIMEFIAFLIDTVDGVPYRPQRPAYWDIGAVLFPVEAAANWAPEIFKIRDVIS